MAEPIDYERQRPRGPTIWTDPRQAWKLAAITVLLGIAGFALLFMAFMLFVFEAE